MWLTGYKYRKKADITNGTTNHQRLITVHRTAGTDTDTDVYISTHCEEDFSDLRFTRADEETLLPYWIEEYTGDYAKVWIKLPPLFVQGEEFIYFYYGNEEAADTSDPEATFIKFDDCEGEEPLEKWIENNGDLGSIEYSTEQKKSGNQSLKVTQESTSDWYRIYTTLNEQNVIFDFWVKKAGSSDQNYSRAQQTGIWGFRFRWERSTTDLEWYNGSQYIDTGHNFTTSWQRHVITCTGTDRKVKWEVDGTVIATDAHEGLWSVIEIWDLFMGEKAYPGTVYFDNIIIRKFGTSVFTWGAEETIKELEICYHAGTDVSLESVYHAEVNQVLEIVYHAYAYIDVSIEIPYHACTDLSLELIYHSVVDQDLEFLYHTYTDTSLEIIYHAHSGMGLEIPYHALTDAHLEISYHSLEYIDFLLEINVQSSIQADCDTARVVIPNDQLVSAASFDVANGEWVIEKLINGEWKRQFCGRCKETWLRSPPPIIEFVLYDYTIFLTQYYITGVYSNIEASLILRGFGTQTQINSLDTDSGNWSASTETEVYDDTEVKKEGSSSLRIECAGDSQWIARNLGEDWSSYGRITFWVRSSCELMNFTLKIVDNFGNWRTYTLKTRDTVNEWKECHVDLCMPTSISGEDMEWASINYITYSNLKNGTHYLDNLRGESGLQDQYGNFANGILYDMQISPHGIEYVGINLTLEFGQTKRIEAVREVRDEVTNLLDEPWEFFIDEWKVAHFRKRRVKSDVVTQVDEENLVSLALKIDWW